MANRYAVMRPPILVYITNLCQAQLFRYSFVCPASPLTPVLRQCQAPAAHYNFTASMTIHPLFHPYYTLFKETRFTHLLHSDIYFIFLNLQKRVRKHIYSVLILHLSNTKKKIPGQ